MAPVFRRKTDEEAFEQLYERHARDVYRYAAAMLGEAADAEDVTQTTFLNAYRSFQGGTRPDKPRSWLIAIAHNVCRQRFRQAQRRPREVAFDDGVGERSVADEPAAPAAADLRRALSQLPPNQRAALVMRELEGSSYAEIAGVLGISVSALETLLFRARRALREQLEEHLTCEEASFAIHRQLEGDLSLGERRGLRAHLRGCAECTSLAQSLRAQRRALKTLVLVPLPSSISHWFGNQSAAAAGGTAGATGLAAVGAATGGGASSAILAGAAAKVAAVVVAGAVVGGGTYTGLAVSSGGGPDRPRPAATENDTGAAVRVPPLLEPVALLTALGAKPVETGLTRADARSAATAAQARNTAKANARASAPTSQGAAHRNPNAEARAQGPDGGSQGNAAEAGTNGRSDPGSRAAVDPPGQTAKTSGVPASSRSRAADRPAKPATAAQPKVAPKPEPKVAARPEAKASPPANGKTDPPVKKEPPAKEPPAKEPPDKEPPATPNGKGPPETAETPAEQNRPTDPPGKKPRGS